MAYSELLQDPRWQKCRLQVLDRDKWTCSLCSDTETTLHVHHKEYTAGALPWEYELDNFICLCKHCHAVVESLKKLGQIPVVATKKTTEFGLYVVCVVPNEGVNIFSFDTEVPRHIITIKKSSLLELLNLIQLSEKLTTNGKGPSHAVVLE